jgi:hypothetical protein
MSQSTSRSQSLSAVTLADGWELQRVTPASRLYGANGLRTAADGRLYVAQVSGSLWDDIHRQPDGGRHCCA